MKRLIFAAARQWLAVLTVIVAGCSGLAVKDSAPRQVLDLENTPDAVPQAEPLSKYGNPKSYQVNGATYRVLSSSAGYAERGIASWYGTKFHGRRTSSGEPYDMYAMTAAHRSLPLPSYARVTNLGNKRSIIVKVNDRGPFHDNRLIDLSYAAATKLGITANGTGLVEVTAIDTREPAMLAQDTAPTRTTETPRLYVQVGAFGQPENARSVAEKLTMNGFQPLVTTIKIGAEVLHRVRLGPLPNVEFADDLVRKLLPLGFSQRSIVID